MKPSLLLSILFPVLIGIGGFLLAVCVFTASYHIGLLGGAPWPVTFLMVTGLLGAALVMGGLGGMQYTDHHS